MIVSLCAAPLAAQFTFFTPPGSFAVEVSLDNSPYPRLPMYRNAITSLEVVGDLAVGGTTAKAGLSPFLFAVSLSQKKLDRMYDLAGAIPGQRAIQSGFGRGPDGALYGGTMPAEAGGSGHLFRARLKGNTFAVEDLGVPVEGQGVFAVAFDPKLETVYGICHPSGKFFAFPVKARSATVYDQAAPTRRELRSAHEFALEPDDVLCRRLVLDRQGRVYGSKPVNKLFRFDPRSKAVEILADELPEVWGRRALGRVDAWTVAPDGALYGGNAGDGQLFRLDPATGKVANLGKPAMMPRMHGLAFAADGKLYGVTGAEPGYAHLFSYDPAGRGFTDLGNPRFTMKEPGIEQGIAWRGFQIGTVAASEDGRYVAMGEDEALSQLMVFPVK
jgi:sugar lactone lactonase YvrE